MPAVFLHGHFSDLVQPLGCPFHSDGGEFNGETRI